MNKLAKTALPLLTIAVFTALWYGIKAIWEIQDFILPPPHDILISLWKDRLLLLEATGTTITGALVGYSLAVSLGFMMSILLAGVSLIRYALYPFVLILQMSPLIATAAIVVVLFDVGLRSVIIITFLICFFPVVANTLQGLLSTPENQLELFRLYKASRLQKLFLLQVPNALPWFFEGARIAATLAVIGSVTGEIFAGSSNGSGGLGFLILIFKSELNIAGIYAATLICCILGFGFVSLISLIRKSILKNWHESVFSE